MIRVNSFLWFLLLVVVSCNNSGSGGPIMTLDMQFDTTCVVVNGGETIISIRNQFIVSDSTDIIRNTVFRNDHSGSFLLTNQTDSIFNKEHRLWSPPEIICQLMPDTSSRSSATTCGRSLNVNSLFVILQHDPLVESCCKGIPLQIGGQATFWCVT